MNEYTGSYPQPKATFKPFPIDRRPPLTISTSSYSSLLSFSDEDLEAISLSFSLT